MARSSFGARARLGRRAFGVLLLVLAACERTDETSAERALEHAKQLVEVARRDVGEVR